MVASRFHIMSLSNTLQQFFAVIDKTPKSAEYITECVNTLASEDVRFLVFASHCVAIAARVVHLSDQSS